MIDRMRNKLILIVTLSLAGIMIIIIGAINLTNFARMSVKADSLLEFITENNGEIPYYDRESTIRDGDTNRFGIGFQVTEETQFETRYFYARIDENDNIYEIVTEHIAAVDAESAVDYISEALEKGREKGTILFFKYLITEQRDGSRLIVFVDCTQQMQYSLSVLLTSGGIAGVSVLIMFFIVYACSKRAIRPVIENIKKQKRFITDAGHELKTPLAIISANSDVLEIMYGKNEWIDSIKNQTSRLDALVKSMLTLAKMDEQRDSIVFVDFDLSTEIEKTVEPFNTMAEQKGKKIVTDIAPEIILHGDQSSVSHMISVLVDNAIKYSAENGEINIKAYKSGKNIKIEIRNKADNIDSSELSKLFERFYRADSSRARETGGFGIGLSIAQSIAFLHNGKIAAFAENGDTVCFCVTL